MSESKISPLQVQVFPECIPSKFPDVESGSSRTALDSTEKPSCKGTLDESKSFAKVIEDVTVVPDRNLAWKEADRASTSDIVIYSVLFQIYGSLFLQFTLDRGVGYGAVTLVMTAIGYIIMQNCIAEVASAIPFSGGSYGLARVFLGFYPGFLVGACEWLQATLFSASACLFASENISIYMTWPVRYETPMWIMLNAFSIFLCSFGGRTIFNISALILLYAFVMYLIFVIQTCRNAPSFHDYAPVAIDDFSITSSGGAQADYSTKSRWFVGPPTNSFFLAYKNSFSTYSGSETILFLTAVAKDAKNSIPYGMVYSMYIYVVIVFVMFLLLCSKQPDAHWTFWPMNSSFLSAFKISINDFDDSIKGSCFYLPIILFNSVQCFFPASLLLRSFAESNLIPKVLASEKWGLLPVLLVQGVAVLGLNVIGYFANSMYEEGGPGFVYNLLQNVAFLCGTCACLADVASFIKLRLRFRAYERTFWSPFGIVGAYYAGCIFVLNIICLLFFSYDKNSCALAFLVILALLSAYYYVIRHEQTLSEDESKCLFRLHVAANNERKNRRRKRTAKKGASQMSRMSEMMSTMKGGKGSATGGGLVSAISSSAESTMVV